MTTRWPREASAGETARPWGSKGDAVRLVRPLTAAVRPILRNLRIGLPAAGRPQLPRGGSGCLAFDPTVARMELARDRINAP
jgi:hypothetical protein